MPKAKDYKQPSRDELLAMRESKIQGAPTSEAARREASFLRNISAAGDDLEWILFNQAWTELGFERVGDWWEKRVLPVLVNLDLRPSVALAQRVIEAISADEASLPKTQRRTQREIATIARTSQAKVSRSRPDARESGSDLENGAKADGSGLVDALRGEIEDVADKQASAPGHGNNQTAADGANASADGERPTSNQGEPAAGSGASPEADRPEPAVIPKNLTDEEPDAPNRDDSSTPPTSDPGVSEPGGQTDPEVPASDTEGSVDGPEQDGTGVARPAPDPSDPAALLEWFADEVWAHVDADVSGPLLTGDDMDMISGALGRIVTGVELLIKWRERTNP